MWSHTFPERLTAWADLRAQAASLPLETALTAVNTWWFQTPWRPYHLHWDDQESWPDPWQLLDDNIYCNYSRALGMIYTLSLLGITDIDLVDATDYNSVDVVLVLVDRAKYVMNYWPGTVVNNKLGDFTITRKYDITPIIQKTGTL
jgi:hypothetical protein